MICNALEELLDLYLDGELSEDDRTRVEAHLAECPACRAYVDDGLALHAALAGDEVDPPAGFADRVMAAVAAQPRKTRKKASVWWKVALPLAACCAIVVAVQRIGPNYLFAGASAPQTAESTAACADDACPATSEETDTTADNGAVFDYCEDADGEAAPSEAPRMLMASSGMTTSANGAVKGKRSAYARTVIVSWEQLDTLPDGAVGEPYSDPESGVCGTGYFLDADTLDRFLAEHPDLNCTIYMADDAATDLCCLLVTD